MNENFNKQEIDQIGNLLFDGLVDDDKDLIDLTDLGIAIRDNSTNSNIDELVKPKRGRGRPKGSTKLKAKTRGLIKKGVVIKKGLINSKNKRATLNENQGENETSSIKVKRGRGRPKKEVVPNNINNINFKRYKNNMNTATCYDTEKLKDETKPKLTLASHELWNETTKDRFVSLINSDLYQFAPFNIADELTNLPQYLKTLRESQLVSHIDFMFVKIPVNQYFLRKERLQHKLEYKPRVNYFDYIDNIFKLINFCKPILLYIEVGIEALDYILNLAGKNDIRLLDNFLIYKTKRLLRFTLQPNHLLENHKHYHYKNNNLVELSCYKDKTKLLNFRSLFHRDLVSFSYSYNDKGKLNNFSFLDFNASSRVWLAASLGHGLSYIGLDINTIVLSDLLNDLAECEIELKKQ